MQYTIDQLKETVLSSTSVHQVLEKLGIKSCGGNYATFYKLIKKYHISTNHFLGQRSNLGKTFSSKRPISDYLKNKYTISSHKLRLRLIKEGYLDAKCHLCGIRTWQNNPLSFELHHVDGDSLNNKLENLWLVCPNCHSQTKSFRRRKPPKI